VTESAGRRTRQLIAEATAVLVKDRLGSDVLQSQVEQTGLLADAKLHQGIEGLNVRSHHFLKSGRLERLVRGVLERPLSLQSVEFSDGWHFEEKVMLRGGGPWIQQVNCQQ